MGHIGSRAAQWDGSALGRGAGAHSNQSPCTPPHPSPSYPPILPPAIAVLSLTVPVPRCCHVHDRAINPTVCCARAVPVLCLCCTCASLSQGTGTPARFQNTADAGVSYQSQGSPGAAARQNDNPTFLTAVSEAISKLTNEVRRWWRNVGAASRPREPVEPSNQAREVRTKPERFPPFTPSPHFTGFRQNPPVITAPPSCTYLPGFRPPFCPVQPFHACPFLLTNPTPFAPFTPFCPILPHFAPVYPFRAISGH